MTFKELKAAVKGRFMNWGKYTAEKLENVSALFDSTTTEDVGKVLTVGEDGSPEWGEGGGGLPPYTSADKGKGLFLVDADPVETDIVPEQTVTVESRPVPLVGADASGFVVGNTGVMTVNGTDYNVTATDMDGAIVYGDQEIGFMIGYDDGEVMCGGEPGTYTVSLTISVPVVVAKWSFNEGGGGLEPKGRISVGITGNYDGSGVKVYGMFSKTDFLGNVTYEQGEHTFSFAQIINHTQPGYAVAVPTVGEGEEEHIDFYLAFASVNNGSPIAASGHTTTMSTQGVTFDRMKNQSNQNRDVWHIVTPNGVTTCDVTVNFYQS